MYPEELAAIDDAFAVLSQPTPDGKLLGDAQAEAVISILERWPTAQLFPVIDLTRLLAGHALHIFHSAAQKERLFAALFKAAEWGASWNPPIPKARETNVLLVLRTAANVLQEGTSLGAEPWLVKVGLPNFTLLHMMLIGGIASRRTVGRTVCVFEQEPTGRVRHRLVQVGSSLFATRPFLMPIPVRLAWH